MTRKINLIKFTRKYTHQEFKNNGKMVILDYYIKLKSRNKILIIFKNKLKYIKVQRKKRKIVLRKRKKRVLRKRKIIKFFKNQILI
jgi:hypothetical protein